MVNIMIITVILLLLMSIFVTYVSYSVKNTECPAGSDNLIPILCNHIIPLLPTLLLVTVIFYSFKMLTKLF